MKNSLVFASLREPVAPLQACDTMVVVVIAVVLIAAIAVEAVSGNPPQCQGSGC